MLIHEVLVLEPDQYSSRAIENYRALGKVVSFDNRISGFNYESITVLVVKLGYQITRDFLSQFPVLQVVATSTTGLDHIDLQAAEERGVKVLSLRDLGSRLESVQSASEFAFGLMVNLVRNVHFVALDTHREIEFFSRDQFVPTRTLRGMRVGIIGMGRIGRFLKKACESFNMKVAFYDVDDGITTDGRVGLIELIKTSEVIFSCAKFNRGDAPILGSNLIDNISQESFLINIGRSGLLDNSLVLKLLLEDKIAGFASDVVDLPLSDSGPLKDLIVEALKNKKNLLITPHVAGYTIDDMVYTEDCLSDIVVDYIKKNDIYSSQ